MLFKEYKQKYPEGYSRSTFCFYLRRYHQTNNVVMHLEHKAGDKLFIDFAGKRLSIVDQESGEIIPVQVFCCYLSLQPAH